MRLFIRFVHFESTEVKHGMTGSRGNNFIEKVYQVVFFLWFIGLCSMRKECYQQFFFLNF